MYNLSNQSVIYSVQNVNSPVRMSKNGKIQGVKNGQFWGKLLFCKLTTFSKFYFSTFDSSNLWKMYNLTNQSVIYSVQNLNSPVKISGKWQSRLKVSKMVNFGENCCFVS